jgi:hypothetical protein
MLATLMLLQGSYLDSAFVFGGQIIEAWAAATRVWRGRLSGLVGGDQSPSTVTRSIACRST